MAWIKQIVTNEAEGKLKDIYDSLRKKRGKVSNIIIAQSLNPDSMNGHMELYLSIMFNQSGLSRAERELIAVVVSSLNGCDYCINHHAEALNHYWKDDEKIKALIKDYKSIDLSIRTLAILKYAEKLTLSPTLVSEHEISNLRIHGLSDENILNINLIVSYFNFANRVAAGLGVEFSEEEITGYNY